MWDICEIRQIQHAYYVDYNIFCCQIFEHINFNEVISPDLVFGFVFMW